MNIYFIYLTLLNTFDIAAIRRTPLGISNPHEFRFQVSLLQTPIPLRNLHTFGALLCGLPPHIGQVRSFTPPQPLKPNLSDNCSGWFTGLSGKFLSARTARLLVLAGAERLDKELMIGQMQGKFQLVVLANVGHMVHEVCFPSTLSTIHVLTLSFHRMTLVNSQKC